VERWTAALKHVEAALQILDECDTPSEIVAVGATLDLAIDRLRKAIDKARPDGS
jgi:hypothetical protein